VGEISLFCSWRLVLSHLLRSLEITMDHFIAGVHVMASAEQLLGPGLDVSPGYRSNHTLDTQRP
jgi:hypothetical protein